MISLGVSVRRVVARTRGSYVVVASVCLAFVGPLWADSVQIGGGESGAWQNVTWTASNTWAKTASPETGSFSRTSPYFDRRSTDGPTSGTNVCNIGYYITNQATNSACGSSVHGSLSPGPSTAAKPLPYWGTSTGQADAQIYIQPSTTTRQFTVTLEAVVAGNYTTDTFGYYTVGASGPTNLIQIFGGSSAGRTVTISFTGPLSNYGFYFKNGSTIYYSQSNYDTSDVGTQHFALFEGAATKQNESLFYIGVEDSAYAARGTGGSDMDYNDMIIRFDAGAATPEPVAWLLMATVGIVLGIVTYRRRSTRLPPTRCSQRS